MAILAKELSPNSRIKRSLAGVDVSNDYLLQSLIFDRLNLLLWVQTEDGSKGRNRPASLYDKLTIRVQDNKAKEGFDSGEDFEKKRKELLTSIKKGGKHIG